MQYSYNWLKELTKTKKNPQELVEMVMLKGFELEEIENLRGRFEKIVVGEILDIKKHPKADKLQVTEVNIGDEKKQIVCGAHNIKVGDKVPVALVGAIVPLNKLEIKKAELRGVESQGMLCAEDELGLGKDHSGIMILNDEAKIGQPLIDCLKLDDTILDFDILPDRAHDCMSYQGMANEICAMEGRQFKVKNEKSKVGDGNKKDLEISIEDKKLCPRYIGTVLDNIEIKSSPKWMQARLVASGMEPINNIVDITNYVMLEIGSPLHAFDFNNVKERVIVRLAKKDEELELLDDTKLKLSEKDLVIADSEKAIGLAGIKGGKYSGINPDTNKIILEAANFDAFNIRKTRQHHCLQTEAQARFEKGISPVLAENATWRAIELLKKYAGAKVEGIVDVNFSKKQEQLIDFDFKRVEKLLGFVIEKKQALKILKDLGFSVKEKKDNLEIKIPYWRLDIEGPEDLIEEIGRIVGYEKIKNQAMVGEVSVVKENKTRSFEWKLRDLFTGMGFDEVMNYSFYSEKDAEVCGIKQNHFEIENPLNQEQTLMRESLFPGVIKNISLNEKTFDNFSIFEIGEIYEEGKGSAPNEKIKITGALLNKKEKVDKSFYQLKGKIESILTNLTKEEISFQSFESGDLEEIFHKSRRAVILVGKTEIGRMGEINLEVLKFYGVKNKGVAFEIDLEKLRTLAMVKRNFSSIRKFPTADRDISMFVNKKIEVARVEEIIKKASKNLISVKLFDIFQQKEADKKSLAFHLEFGAESYTLKNEEVDLDMANIIKNLEKEGIDVRKE